MDGNISVAYVRKEYALELKEGEFPDIPPSRKTAKGVKNPRITVGTIDDDLRYVLAIPERPDEDVVMFSLLPDGWEDGTPEWVKEVAENVHSK